MVILAVAALVILGPERLPGAIRWTAQSLRQLREYASGATTQLRSELGPEFDELRAPLEQLQELRHPLNQLRGMTPRSVVTKHLLGGDDSLFTGNFTGKPVKPVTTVGNAAQTPAPDPQPPASSPHTRADPPPIDLDAT